ncbi:hypothetical protein [Emcibacter sp.]|uniref:hypothetical protein n=1 Tax=Emcibacter sp. TaxID=1979954 RepID=UPI002AA61F12|nr:hypothetical protein [Emcibacter sp.]
MTALKRFEVSLYNQQVRDYERKGRVHPSFDTSWADLNFFTFECSTAEEALSQIEKKYPSRKGFVVSQIIEVKEFEFVRPTGVRV